MRARILCPSVFTCLSHICLSSQPPGRERARVSGEAGVVDGIVYLGDGGDLFGVVGLWAEGLKTLRLSSCTARTD